MNERIVIDEIEISHAELERELEDLLDLNTGDKILSVDSNTEDKDPTKRRVRVASIVKYGDLDGGSGE